MFYVMLMMFQPIRRSNCFHSRRTWQVSVNSLQVCLKIWSNDFIARRSWRACCCPKVYRLVLSFNRMQGKNSFYLVCSKLTVRGFQVDRAWLSIIYLVLTWKCVMKEEYHQDSRPLPGPFQ